MKKNGAVLSDLETDMREPISHLVLMLYPIGSLFSYIGSTVSTAVDFYSKFGLKIFIPCFEGEEITVLVIVTLEGDYFKSYGVVLIIFLGDPRGDPAALGLEVTGLDTLAVLGGEFKSGIGAFFSLGLPIALITFAGILLTWAALD